MATNPTDPPAQCETCDNRRKIHHAGREAGPCPDCSYVLTRSHLPNVMLWSTPGLLSYRAAEGVLAVVAQNGGIVYGTLNSSETVEYITRHPKVMRWEFRPIPYEEGRSWLAAHEADLNKDRALRFIS